MSGLWSTAARCRGRYRWPWIRSMHTLVREGETPALDRRKRRPQNSADTATSTRAPLDVPLRRITQEETTRETLVQEGEREQDLERRQPERESAIAQHPRGRQGLKRKVPRWKSRISQQGQRKRWENGVLELLRLAGASDLAHVVRHANIDLAFQNKTTIGVLDELATEKVRSSFQPQETVSQSLQEATDSTESMVQTSHPELYDDVKLHDREDLRMCEFFVRQEGTAGKFSATDFGDQRFPKRLPSTAVAVVDGLLERVYDGNPRRLSPDSAFNAIRMLKSDGYPRYRRMQIYSVDDSVKKFHSVFKESLKKARWGLRAARKRRAQLKATITHRLSLGDHLFLGPRYLRWTAELKTLNMAINRLRLREQRAVKRLETLLITLKVRINDENDTLRAPAINFLQLVWEARGRLNEANDKVFAEWDSRRREMYVAKLCYNLLVSEYPPGVSNYNTLLLGLSKVGEHDLAQVIADHCLGWSDRRQSEAMLHCLVTHYRRKGNYAEYQKLLQQFTGHDGASVLRPVRANVITEFPRLRKWAERYAVGVRDGFVLEVMPLNHHHLNAIIGGLLDFGNTRGAASLVFACQRDGIKVSSRIKYRLLSRCINTMDGRLARMLIARMLAGSLEDGIQNTTFFAPSTRRDWEPWNWESVNSVAARRSRGDRLRALLTIAWGRRFPIGEAPKARKRADPARPLRGKGWRLTEDRVRHLAVVAWVAWTQQHLVRVNEILRSIGSAVSQAELNYERLSELDDMMAEEHRFLHQKSQGNEWARTMAERKWLEEEVRWLDEEVASSLHTTRSLRLEMMSIRLGNSFWATSGLLAEAPYRVVKRLSAELRQPDSRASRVLRCVDQCTSASLEHRKILLRFLATLTPPEEQGGALVEEVRSMTNEEVFGAVLERLTGKRSDESERGQSLMEKFKTWALGSA
ncbi:hypothetical protein QBC34DRAFT_390654 [Podospora aff. communis PSN243]|uniref:Pentatricopeptide repeat domain-containing protein n=1 Tax=Podospora aff. communis PSN243 TaxID=3040156 RepID=A0AAV9H3Q0_9PEZI|nr:hypothetical protein QBC34DRAFT_390654 [Podospora aff. communis PSN243]